MNAVADIMKESGERFANMQEKHEADRLTFIYNTNTPLLKAFQVLQGLFCLLQWHRFVGSTALISVILDSTHTIPFSWPGPTFRAKSRSILTSAS